MTEKFELDVDFDTISKLRQLTPPPIFGELIELYLDDSRRRLGDIKSSFQEGDLEALSSAAHGLKGSSLSIGVSSVAEISANIERIALAGDQRGLENLVNDVEQRFLELVGMLEALITED